MLARRPLLIAAALMITVTACSGNISFSIGGKSPESAAEELIEGDLSAQVGLELEANCPELEDPKAGDSFECIGTAADGRIVDFVVDIADDEVLANSTNLLTADAVPGFEQSIIRALNAENGLNLPDQSLDCGEGALIVARDSTVLCRLRAPGSSDVYDTTITITDQANWRFDIAVADSAS